VTKTRWIGKDVDFHDPSVCHGEAHHRHRASIGKPRDDPRGSVDECQASGLSESREHQRPLRDRTRPSFDSQCSLVAPEHNVGIQNGKQSVKVACA